MFETLKQRRRGCFRSVPIPDSLTAVCRELTTGLQSSSRLWPFSRATAYRLVKEYMARAGIAGGMASPKGLRHGFAVACLAQKIPLTTAKNWLAMRGWKPRQFTWKCRATRNGNWLNACGRRTKKSSQIHLRNGQVGLIFAVNQNA